MTRLEIIGEQNGKQIVFIKALAALDISHRVDMQTATSHQVAQR